jgi:hypothetical protein
MSIQTDQAQSDKAEDVKDPGDQPVDEAADKPEPRRAAGGTHLPVIPPKTRPKPSAASKRTTSSAKPNGSAVSADTPVTVSPEDAEPSDNVADQPAENASPAVKPPPDDASTPPAAEPAAVAEPENKPEASLPEATPPSFAPEPARRAGPVFAKPLGDWAEASSGQGPDFKAMVLGGSVPPDQQAPRFVGASESGTMVVGGKRRAGGKPMPPPPDASEPVAVPVGGIAGSVTVPPPSPPRPVTLRPERKPMTGRTHAEPAVPAAEAANAAPRRVKLQIARVSPWSMAKMSFLLSVACGIAFVVVVFMVWQVLNSAHLFTTIEEQIEQLAGPAGAAKFNFMSYVEQGKVLAGATVIAVVNIVLGTILGTLGALIYNITAILVGGIHVTMSDD